VKPRTSLENLSDNGFSSIRFIPFDQLNRSYGALREAVAGKDLILFIESHELIASRKWHIQRIHLLLSAARHLAVELSKVGFDVLYLQAEDFSSGFTLVQERFPNLPLIAAKPNSYSLYALLQERGFTLVENDFFLTPERIFKEWASDKKTLLMESFYREQRKRLNILVESGKPVGGSWNFDSENRERPPKNHHWPKTLLHHQDQIDLDLIKELRERYPLLWGSDPSHYWATTRKGALEQLDNFLNFHFAEFGPLEDAMPLASDSWQVHHSLLSPYLNIGLLHPSEVIDAALARFEAGGIPIASCEGFIRQIIGWREYVYGLYWFFGYEYRFNNQLEANRELLPLFHDPEKTEMNCLKDVITAVKARAWHHHIPRLMILSNLALLSGVSPEKFLHWFSEVFIDAFDWVMVPNVIGMGVHSDGGAMMTKPYAAGGSYISKMSHFCGGCRYDPKLRIGEDSCPFTTLYWDFLDRHRERFIKNQRISQQVRGLDRLKDLAELRIRAQDVLDGLSKGTI
jgi:deoxyribodipyrimidine photolyase-related protein